MKQFKISLTNEMSGELDSVTIKANTDQYLKLTEIADIHEVSRWLLGDGDSIIITEIT